MLVTQRLDYASHLACMGPRIKARLGPLVGSNSVNVSEELDYGYENILGTPIYFTYVFQFLCVHE